MKNTPHLRFLHTLFAIGISALLTLAAAESSGLDGKWKLNMEKSKLAGQSFVITKKDAGKMNLDMQGFAFDFDLTGKEFPTPDGGTTSVKAPDSKTWEFTGRMDGKIIGRHIFRLDSPDTATLTMEVPQEDGKNLETVTDFKRVSGGPGLVGKWKSTEVKGACPGIDIKTKGENEIEFVIPEFKMSCSARFDGKDYPVSVNGADTKQTFAFEKKGPRGFKLTTKIDGKPFYVENFTLSEDGKTLMDEGNFVAADEPMTAVFEKE